MERLTLVIMLQNFYQVIWTGQKKNKHFLFYNHFCYCFGDISYWKGTNKTCKLAALGIINKLLGALFGVKFHLFFPFYCLFLIVSIIRSHWFQKKNWKIQFYINQSHL